MNNSNNSVIVQVDASTKGILEEIQSGISTSIDEGMRSVNNLTESKGDEILRKFKSFDGINRSLEELRSLAEDSRKFDEMVTPLQDGLTEIRDSSRTNEQTLSEQAKTIAALIQKIAQIEATQANLSQEIKTGIINELISLKGALGGIQSRISENASNSEALMEQLSKVQSGFVNSYMTNEQRHAEFENKATTELAALRESVEKLQASIDIVINLVTPFWKKWFCKK